MRSGYAGTLRAQRDYASGSEGGRVRRYGIGVMVALLMASSLSAQAPLSSPGTSGTSPPGVPGIAEPMVGRGPLFSALVSVQQRMNASLRELMTAVRTGGLEVWMVLVVLGLVYGIIHSLLPGHRKMLLFSYFLSRPAPIRHGVIAGVALGVLHALTAIAVVMIGYTVLQLSVSATVEQATGVISRITAGFIVVLGAFLLVTHLKGHAHHHSHDADCDQSHGHHSHQTELPRWLRGFATRHGLLGALIVSGIVPCPGATMVLLLAVALAAVPAGLVVVVSMSAGMALTLAVLSVLTILFKQRMSALLNSERGHRLHVLFEIATSAFIMVFGILLLLGPVG